MHRKNPNRKFSLRFGKEEMSTEDKRRRLRRLVPSWSFLTRLRRPLLFRLAGKEGGEKGRLGTRLVRPASESRQGPMFQASFHTIVTLRIFWYAPPDTGVPSLRLVALERLLSIEGTGEILMDVTFLRWNNLSASLCSAPPLDKGRLWGAHVQGSPCQGELARSA